MIWTVPATVEQANALRPNTLSEHLDIVFTEIGDDYLTATMPVDHRTHQPMGLLHGGASVALAETVGSVGANLCVDSEKHACVGLEINANHIRAVRSGRVTATGRPLHLGGRTQVWEIRLEDDHGRLTCISRLTMAVIDRR